MKQCSICGYLFQPDESQPLCCPRCGIPFEEHSSRENTPETSQDPPAFEDSPQEPEFNPEDLPAAAPQEEISSQAQQTEEVFESEPVEQKEDSSNETEMPETATEESPVQDSSPPSDAAPVALPEKKRRWPKLLLLFLLLLLVAVISFFLGMGQQIGFFQEEDVSSSAEETQSSSTSSYYNAQGVSSEEFAQLHTGMTYAQISAIIGGDAYQTTVPDVSGSYSAAWLGQDDPDAVLTVRFVNGQAVDLQQSGLTEETSSQDSESASQ